MKPDWKPSFSWLCSGRGLANPASIGCFKFQLLRNCRFLFSSQLTLFTKNSQPLDGQPVFIKLPQLCKRTASFSNYPCALDVRDDFPQRNPAPGGRKTLQQPPLPPLFLVLVKLWTDSLCQLILFWYGSFVILTGGLERNWMIVLIHVVESIFVSKISVCNYEAVKKNH